MADANQVSYDSRASYGNKRKCQYAPRMPVPSMTDVDGANYLKPKALDRELSHMLNQGTVSGIEIKAIRNMQGRCMQVGIGPSAFYFKRSAAEPFAFIPKGSATAYLCNTLTGDETRQRLNEPIVQQIKSGLETLEYIVEVLS